MSKEEKCILCEEEAVKSSVQGKDGYSVICDICGRYFLGSPEIFEGSYTSMPREKRRMLQAYTRELFELGEEPPELGNPDELKDIITDYEGKTVDEKLDNLIWYLRKNSEEYGGSVPWKIERDYPITYSLSPQGFEKIVHLARDNDLLVIESRDSLKLTEEGWKLGTKLLEDKKK